ncbi:hypothetical protein GR702_21320 [Novosphingobium sp. FGD1]|uniref:Uncharacterized protein n=1 Tax=Novosphingobium silvae TaxID=2692619 RepID=A0A7X4GKD7_9SPHN|nr:hypothetical protein [Novosphingobium silvae]MYM00289.1 hypothetical protein [Novosphingobium silvae]
MWRNDIEELKPWRASKSIWTVVIGSLRGGAAALDILPEGLMQANILTVVLALTGIGSVVFRKTARARIL